MGLLLPLLLAGCADPDGRTLIRYMAWGNPEQLQTEQKIIAERVALQAWQVAEFGLPTSPAKSTDSRSAKWTGGTCQVEALPPDGWVWSTAVMRPPRADSASGGPL